MDDGFYLLSMIKKMLRNSINVHYVRFILSRKAPVALHNRGSRVVDASHLGYVTCMTGNKENGKGLVHIYFFSIFISRMSLGSSCTHDASKVQVLLILPIRSFIAWGISLPYILMIFVLLSYILFITLFFSVKEIFLPFPLDSIWFWMFVLCQSPVDGKPMLLTPEESIQIQVTA